MTIDERPLGAVRRSNGNSSGGSTPRSRGRPPWLYTQDGTTAGVTRTPARFPLNDILASPSTGRRGTGAFLPCVQLQKNPAPQSPQHQQPMPRPSGKATSPNNNNNNRGTVTGTATTIKKPRPSPSTPKRGVGPGMHVVFVDSSSRPCGTGVFLPRSTTGSSGEQHQHPHRHQSQHRGSHDKKPPAAAVLLPTRVMHLLSLERASKHHAPAPWAAVAESPHQMTTAMPQKDKIQEGQRRHQTRHEVEEPGISSADADYDDARNHHHHHESSNTSKCSVPLLQTHASGTLIEKLLPEEWSY